MPQEQRVIAYIDGFNLYYGLRAAKLQTSRWLDLRAMCQALLKPSQRLDLVRYFTTRVRNNPSAAERQGIFIDALKARGNLEIDYGHFLSKHMTCHDCGNTWHKSEEKKTDVNIAVRLINDAHDDLFDAAIIVSGDSDLTPPVESIRRRFPRKRLLIAFPPKRNSHQLGQVAHTALKIPKAVIRSSRLPDPVITSSGMALKAPVGWIPS